MSCNWPEVTIDELKSSKKGSIAMGPFGSRIKAENFVKSGVPVLKGGNLHSSYINDDECDYLTEEKADELKSSNAFEGDIVITHRGTIGQVSIIPENAKYNRYVVSQSQLKVSLDKKRVNPYYVNYFLRSRIGQHRLLSYASQVGVPAIAKASTSVRQIKVPCPPLTVQNEIVSFLQSLDHKITLNTQTNQTLEQIAQAIFKSWFVDFDPVKAKMNGEQAEGMDAATASLFPEKLVESELGLIPDGWKLTNIGKVSECFDKKRIPLSKRQREQKQGSIPYHGATSVMDYVDEAIFDDIYLLIGEDGSVMKDDGTPFIQYIWGPAWVNNHAHVLKGIASVSTEQLMLFFQQTNINAYVTGAVQLKINQGNMNRIPFVKATEDINHKFYEIIAPLYAKARAIKEENEQLAKLRDTLLPKLLSGEIELADN